MMNKIKDTYGAQKFVVDNFENFSSLMKPKAADGFYFINIIQREKDNPDKGIRYCNYLSNYWVHNAEELMATRDKIVRECRENNARAYIWLNERLENEVLKYAEIYRQRHMHAATTRAAGKSFRMESRPVCMLDLDTDDERIFKDLVGQIESVGARWMEYRTPNGGHHLIVFDYKKAELLDLKKYDGGRDLGWRATVALEYDKPVILFADLIDNGVHGMKPEE